MEPNPIRRMQFFDKLLAEVFQRAGELSALDGSQIGIYIKHPLTGDIIAWPSPEVANERFMRYLIDSAEPSQVNEGPALIEEKKNNPQA